MGKYALAIGLSLLVGNTSIKAEDLPKTTYLRFVQASIDAPPLDIYLNDKLVSSSLSFKAITDYKSMKPGTYNLKIIAVGEKTPIVERKLTSLKPGTAYTFVTSSLLNGMKSYIFSSKLADDKYSKAKVNVFHFSLDAPTIDIWQGAEAANVKKKKVITKLEFAKRKSYTATPGSAFLQTVENNQPEPILNKLDLQLKAGKNYSIFSFGMFKTGNLEFVAIEDKIELINP